MAKKKPQNMAYFEVRAFGDVIHIEAKDRADAERQYRFNYGDMIPPNHPSIKWKELKVKPKADFIFNPPADWQ